MAEQITDQQFTEAEGVEDWRTLFWGAKTLYRTGTFTKGAELISAIAVEAEALGHDPIVDLRDDTVTVQVFTIGVGLSDLDVLLAQRISVAAAALGLTADPSVVQDVQLAIDVADREPILEFWRAALGHVRVGPDNTVEPNLIGPTLWFQDKPHVAPRNRIHVDVSVPHDVAQQRVDAILAAGGRMLGDRYAPAWWSLIDSEGNVVDVCTWQGREGFE